MTRRAADTICAPCWTYTLAGIDADVAGLPVAVDNFPLSRQGELLAVVAGRAVYALDIRGELHRRDRWALRRPSKEPVLAEHRCGQPLPAAWLAPATPRPRPSTSDEGMPF